VRARGLIDLVLNPASSAVAFAPGRVNLIGEHTDYNEGLSLPFAIAEGVTVRARRQAGGRTTVYSRWLNERDSFDTQAPTRCEGWRSLARGVAAELREAGYGVVSAEIEIDSDLPAGAGLSSSAALEVSLALAFLALAGTPAPDHFALARLCSRVEHQWLGARTGLLDQLASLLGDRDTAHLIDFRTESAEAVPLALGDWTLVTIQTPTNRALADSGYNERREQCGRAAQLLRMRSLRDAGAEQLEGLPEPMRRRARHVLSENARVRSTVSALRRGDLAAVGELMNRSHASLRDDYEVSTSAVEEIVEGARRAGARGARLMGGGFGGTVLALFEPGISPPAAAVHRTPASGACVVDTRP